MKEHHNNYNNSNIPLLTCAFLAALTTGGPVYAFGIYGAELKESLALSQSQLDTISSANFCAGLLSWMPGLLIDAWGVRLSIMAGSSSGAVSMMLYWAVARQLFAVHTVLILPMLCGLGLLIFLSNSLVIGSIFKLLVSTCAPNTKGSAVGAAKGFVGLGSGVYACLFQALKTPALADLDFLPLAAFLAVVMGCVPALLLLPADKNRMDALLIMPSRELDQMTARHLQCLYIGLVLLASMVLGTTLASLVEDNYNDDMGQNYDVATEIVPERPQYAKAVLIVVAWLAPILALLVLPPKSKLVHDNVSAYEEIQDVVAEVMGGETEEDGSHDPSGDVNNGVDQEEAPHEFQPLIKQLSSPALAYGAEISASVQVSGPRGMLGGKAVVRNEPLPNLTLTQVLRTTPAWLFAWVIVIRVGGGTMVTNNMGQMVESLHLPRLTTTPASLAVFSVAQAASRVATGAVSDWALSWKFRRQFNSDTQEGVVFELNGIPRPAFLIIASLAGTLAQLFMTIATTRNFFLLGVCFSGAAFGMIWPLMVLIVGEVFGTANMGANYMFFDGLSAALGTLLLSKYVTQEVYERHIIRGSDEDVRTCYGQECFFGSHIIIAVLSFTCVIASYWFYHSTRHVYASRLS